MYLLIIMLVSFLVKYKHSPWHNCMTNNYLQQLLSYDALV